MSATQIPSAGVTAKLTPPAYVDLKFTYRSRGFNSTVFATAMCQFDPYRNDNMPIKVAELPELRSDVSSGRMKWVERVPTGASWHEETHNLVVVGSSPTRPTEGARWITTGFCFGGLGVEAL